MVDAPPIVPQYAVFGATVEDVSPETDFTADSSRKASFANDTIALDGNSLNQGTADSAGEDRIDAEAGKLGGPFLDLFWPGWPPHLPTPALLDHVSVLSETSSQPLTVSVETFFAKVPTVPRILHRPTFLKRLTRPPTHPDFPHVALLHAICAAAGRYTAAVRVASTEEVLTRHDGRKANGFKRLNTQSLEDDIASETCFAQRNARYTQLEMRFDSVMGRQMLELVQAQIILAFFFHQSAQ